MKRKENLTEKEKDNIGLLKVIEQQTALDQLTQFYRKITATDQGALFTNEASAREVVFKLFDLRKTFNNLNLDKAAFIYCVGKLNEILLDKSFVQAAELVSALEAEMKSPHAALHLLDLGKIFVKQKNYNKALTTYEKSLQGIKDYAENGLPQNIVTNLKICLYGEIHEIYSQLLSKEQLEQPIYKEGAKKFYNKIPEQYKTYAMYIHEGELSAEPQDKILYLEKAIELIKNDKSLQYTNIQLMKLYTEIATQQMNIGNIETAEKSLMLSLSLVSEEEEERSEAQSYEIFSATHSLLLNLTMQNKLEEAYKIGSEIYDKYRNIDGIPTTYATLLINMHKYDDALKIFEQVYSEAPVVKYLSQIALDKRNALDAAEAEAAAKIFAEEMLRFYEYYQKNGFASINEYYQGLEESISVDTPKQESTLEKHIITQVEYYDRPYAICFDEKLIRSFEKNELTKIKAASDHFAQSAKDSNGIICVSPNIFKIKFGEDKELVSKISSNGRGEGEVVLLFNDCITHNGRDIQELYHKEGSTVNLEHIIGHAILLDDFLELTGKSEYIE